MNVVLTILLCIVIVYLIISYVMFVLICKKISNNILPMSNLVDETLKPYKDIIQVGIDWTNDKRKNNEIKDVYIKSYDNLKLHGVFIENMLDDIERIDIY